MPLVQTHGWKFKSDLDYMTLTEKRLFDKLVEAEEVTLFSLGRCEVCKTYIPKIKKYCSIECKTEKEGEQDVDERMDGPSD